MSLCLTSLNPQSSVFIVIVPSVYTSCWYCHHCVSVPMGSLTSMACNFLLDCHSSLLTTIMAHALCIFVAISQSSISSSPLILSMLQMFYGPGGYGHKGYKQVFLFSLSKPTCDMQSAS